MASLTCAPEVQICQLHKNTLDTLLHWLGLQIKVVRTKVSVSFFALSLNFRQPGLLLLSHWTAHDSETRVCVSDNIELLETLLSRRQWRARRRQLINIYSVGTNILFPLLTLFNWFLLFSPKKTYSSSLDPVSTPFKLSFHYLLFTKFLRKCLYALPMFSVFWFFHYFLQLDFYLCHYSIETSSSKVLIAKSNGLGWSLSFWTIAFGVIYSFGPICLKSSHLSIICLKFNSSECFYISLVYFLYSCLFIHLRTNFLLF